MAAVTSVRSQVTPLQRFRSIYPRLESALLARVNKYRLPEPFKTRFLHNVEHNILGSSCIFGVSVPDCVLLLQGGTALSDEQYFDAATLGWMIELLQSVFGVCDDIKNSSATRHGKVCWYRAKGVGLMAINDASMLESAIYILLAEFFRTHPSYTSFVELFHEISLETQLGRLPKHGATVTESAMCDQACNALNTPVYSFYLPATLALHQLNLATPKNLEQSKKILMVLGEYQQLQDKAGEAGEGMFALEWARDVRAMIEQVDEAEGLKRAMFEMLLNRAVETIS